jgi:hypothetical protein
MKDKHRPTIERVRIDFDCRLLNCASTLAYRNGETLSLYVNRLIAEDLAIRQRLGTG